MLKISLDIKDDIYIKNLYSHNTDKRPYELIPIILIFYWEMID